MPTAVGLPRSTVVAITSRSFPVAEYRRQNETPFHIGRDSQRRLEHVSDHHINAFRTRFTVVQYEGIALRQVEAAYAPVPIYASAVERL